MRKAVALKVRRGMGRRPIQGGLSSSPTVARSISAGARSGGLNSIEGADTRSLPSVVASRSDLPGAGRDLQPPEQSKPTNRFAGYVMRGRWMTDDRYAPLRNAAWLLRNSRVGQVNNPAALRVVIHAAEGLLASGDELADVLEAFAELLVHP